MKKEVDTFLQYTIGNSPRDADFFHVHEICEIVQGLLDPESATKNSI